MKKSLKKWTLMILCLNAWSISGSNPELYPLAPGSIIDTRLSVRINDKLVKADYFKNFHIIDHIHFFESTRVRFATDKAVNVQIDVDQPVIKTAFLRCVGKDLKMEIDKASLKFVLPGPGNYYLQLPDLAKPNSTYTVLFFVDDLLHVQKQREMVVGEGYVNVNYLGIVSDDQADQTEKIQEILLKGGKILFPAGVYRTGNLKIGSNTSIFLSPGALIKGTDHYHTTGASALIDMVNAENIRISGMGIIDANGMVAFDSIALTTIHGFDIAGCKEVSLEDFTVQGTNSWCVHIKFSEKFTADNLKIFSGKDGFDPDASHDVVIKNSSIQSLDDAFAVKNRYPDKSTTERILMKNCIVTSVKSSLKIGTETRGLIKDVTWEDMDVYDCERGIVMYACDGGPVENVIWRNVRLFMVNWIHEKLSGTAFHLNIRMRDKPTPVKNCLIENVTANFIGSSQFEGLQETPLDGIKMRNIAISVGTPKRENLPLFECTKYVDLTLEEFKIDWNTNKHKWSGLVSGKGLKIL
jgi:hypothetical protein